MKALFGRSQRNYPDHHNPDFAHPYYPNKTAQGSNVSHMPEVQPNDRNSDRNSDRAAERNQANTPVDRARSTLDALQMIRRRFEESQKEQPKEQVAA